MTTEGSLGLSNPRSLKKIVSRQRLRERLQQAVERKLVVLYGKAGQGKSTLMAEYLSSRAARGFWCSLVAEDADPSSFLSKVKTCLVSPKHPAQSASLEAILASLEPVDEPTWIVLDNVQVVNSSLQACGIIEELIFRLPNYVRIAVLSREYPGFSLADVLAARQLAMIEDRELAFNREESAELFQSIYRIALSAAELSDILELTEGWITSLVHLAEILGGKP